MVEGQLVIVSREEGILVSLLKGGIGSKKELLMKLTEWRVGICVRAPWYVFLVHFSNDVVDVLFNSSTN